MIPVKTASSIDIDDFIKKDFGFEGFRLGEKPLTYVFHDLKKFCSDNEIYFNLPGGTVSDPVRGNIGSYAVFDFRSLSSNLKGSIKVFPFPNSCGSFVLGREYYPRTENKLVTGLLNIFLTKYNLFFLERPPFSETDFLISEAKRITQSVGGMYANYCLSLYFLKKGTILEPSRKDETDNSTKNPDGILDVSPTPEQLVQLHSGELEGEAERVSGDRKKRA